MEKADQNARAGPVSRLKLRILTLMTSFTLDIKLQNRWFPATDGYNASFSYVEVAEQAAVGMSESVKL